MKTAVITGATGGIGRALISLCIREGYEVLAIVHRESKRAGDLERIEHCHMLSLDLDEYADGMEVIKKSGIELSGYELFFHLAWKAPFGSGRDDLNLQLSNVKCALAAVELASELGCSTFVGAGSQAEYGRTEGKLSPDTPAFPETGYGVAKLCAGQMTRLRCEQLGMKHIWTRILSVYGPCDGESTLISTAIRCMVRGEGTEFSPCEQMWDYIYTDDAARALLIAAQKGSSGSLYVIGGGRARPLKDYIMDIAAITGYDREIGFGKREYNPKQVMHLEADISALEETGFRPMVTFKEGIQSILDLTE
mgnify:CR=1 FL=1